MRARLFVLVVALLIAFAGACRKKKKPVVPQTPAQLAQELNRAAVNDRNGRLFDLLDEASRWSIMSIYRARREACELIRADYPEEQQARELSRCKLALLHPDPESYFGAYAKQHHGRVIRPLKQLGGGGLEIEEKGTGRATLIVGDTKLSACKSEDVWTYCELRDTLEQTKIKAARDLKMVRDNVETYRERR
jgi:hypothetical protein